MTSFEKLSHTTNKPTRLLRKVVVFVATAAMIGLALIFSALLLAVVVTAAAVALGYLWWRTRDLRKQMREHPPGNLVIGGEVIEGEVIREVDFRDVGKR